MEYANEHLDYEESHHFIERESNLCILGMLKHASSMHANKRGTLLTFALMDELMNETKYVKHQSLYLDALHLEKHYSTRLRLMEYFFLS